MKSSLDLVRFAEVAADRAAGYLRSVERPRDPAQWGIKGHRDFVSEADRRAEEIIGSALREATPDSGMVGEEGSPELRDRGLVWIVDPIDGTTNFLHGFPAYSVSIAAAVDGVLEAGVVLMVETGQVFRAWRGGGAWCGERRLAVSSITDPAHALLGTGFPFKHPALLPVYQRQFAALMLATSGIRRAGSAALDLAWVAAGVLDGFWELELAPWDIAAGLLLVREAGGRVTDLDGRDLVPAHTPVIAGNPSIHRWLVDAIARAADEPSSQR